MGKRDVFINCPFDDEYRPLFEALVFAVTAAGYNVRCALEDDDGANIRFEKLRKLIAVCPRTIHDLSRTGLGGNDLPRFNMPFELGLAMGLKYFGPRSKRKNSALILIKKQYSLAGYLSDLAGNDPQAHEDDPKKLIRFVLRYLKRTPANRLLQGPGPASMIGLFEEFKSALPTMAEKAERTVDEVHPFHDYPVFLTLVTEFLIAIDGI